MLSLTAVAAIVSLDVLPSQLTLMTLPPCALGTHQPFTIRMLQLDPSTNTAAPGTC